MLKRLLEWLRPECPEPEVPELSTWFEVSFDDRAARLDVRPPGGEPWSAEVPWASLQRVCYQAKGLECSDGIYLFTDQRPESYAVPIEAQGGPQLWSELIRRRLFDADLAIEVASALEGQFWWPAPDAPPLPTQRPEDGAPDGAPTAR